MAINLQEIEDFVVSYYDVELSKRDRKENFVKARCLFSKLAKQYTAIPNTKIGKHMNRHHATVIHYESNVFPSYERDKYFMKVYNNFKEIYDKKMNDHRMEIEGNFIPKVSMSEVQLLREENNEIKFRFNEYKQRNARFNDLLDVLDTERKREELFFKLENAVKLLKNANFY
jgi:hypothetical protein